MLRMRGFCAALLACLLACAAGVAQAARAADDPAARAYLAEACRETARAESLHADIAMELKTSCLNASSLLQADFILKEPFLGRMTTELTLRGFGTNVSEPAATEYIVREDGGALAVYAARGGEWQRRTIALAEGPLTRDPLAYVKRARFGKRTAELTTLEVALDMEKLSGELLRLLPGEPPRQLAAKPLNPADWTRARKLLVRLLRAAGEVSYVVTVDNASRRMVNLYMDLSVPARRAALAALAELDAPQAKKAQLREMLREMSLVLQEDFSRFDAVPRFALPEAVRRSAAAGASELPPEIESDVVL